MAEKADSLPDGLSSELRSRIRWLLTEFHVNILTAVYWRIAAPWSLPDRRVADSFFIFPTVGVVEVASEGRMLRAARGEFIMLRDNVEHRVGLAEGCQRAEWVAVHCHIANAWRTPALDYFTEACGRLSSPEANLAELTAFVSLFNIDAFAGQNWGGQILKSLLTQAILAGAALAPMTEKADPRISKSLSTIRTLYSKNVSVEKLAALGVNESEPNVRNKLSRGKFTAVFLIQCLEAIGASEVRL